MLLIVLKFLVKRKLADEFIQKSKCLDLPEDIGAYEIVENGARLHIKRNEVDYENYTFTLSKGIKNETNFGHLLYIDNEISLSKKIVTLAEKATKEDYYFNPIGTYNTKEWRQQP